MVRGGAPVYWSTTGFLGGWVAAVILIDIMKGLIDDLRGPSLPAPVLCDPGG